MEETDEDRRSAFMCLVEDLYSDMLVISESNEPNKNEIYKQFIIHFYAEYKKRCKIENIEEIVNELKRVNQDNNNRINMDEIRFKQEKGLDDDMER